MANMTFTDAEVAEVRFHTGSGGRDPNKLTDDAIKSDSVLGSACDYVYEQVLNGIDLDALTTAERDIVDRDADDVEDDITAFINTVLKPPQRKQFRRAIVYRSAGILVQSLDDVEYVGAVGITDRLAKKDWRHVQTGLYGLSEDEIRRLRNAFHDDAFPSKNIPAPINIISLV